MWSLPRRWWLPAAAVAWQVFARNDDGGSRSPEPTQLGVGASLIRREAADRPVEKNPVEVVVDEHKSTAARHLEGPLATIAASPNVHQMLPKWDAGNSDRDSPSLAEALLSSSPRVNDSAAAGAAPAVGDALQSVADARFQRFLDAPSRHGSFRDGVFSSRSFSDQDALTVGDNRLTQSTVFAEGLAVAESSSSVQQLKGTPRRRRGRAGDPETGWLPGASPYESAYDLEAPSGLQKDLSLSDSTQVMENHEFDAVRQQIAQDKEIMPAVFAGALAKTLDVVAQNASETMLNDGDTALTAEVNDQQLPPDLPGWHPDWMVSMPNSDNGKANNSNNSNNSNKSTGLIANNSSNSMSKVPQAHVEAGESNNSSRKLSPA